MGVRLVAEVIHHAPCDVIDQEWKMLIILAEDANDKTRECWPGMDELRARSHKGRSTVRRLLTGLEERKLIRRLPARRIQPGAAEVVAHRGRRTVYRVEVMPGMSDTEALTCEHLSDEKGAHPRAERRSPVSKKALTGEPPSPHVPSGPLITSAADVPGDVIAAVRDTLRERTGRDVGDQWARTVAASLLVGRGGLTAPARWIRTVIQRETNLQRFLPVPEV